MKFNVEIAKQQTLMKNLQVKNSGYEMRIVDVIPGINTPASRLTKNRN